MKENSEQKTFPFAPSKSSMGKLNARYQGPWVIIEGLANESNAADALKKCTTLHVKKKEDPTDPTSPEILVPVEMAHIHGDNSYRIPAHMLDTASRVLDISPPAPRKASDNLAFNTFPVLASFSKVITRQGPLVPSGSQMWIINEEIKKDKKGEGAYIKAAMGGGKTMLCAHLLLANPDMRPAVLAGRSSADTKQLHTWLKKLLELNPEYNTEENRVIQWGASKSPNKKDKELLAQGKGIIVMTHRGVHNIPDDTKLLILDEAHCAATIATMTEIIKHGGSLERLYAFSGTPNMRNDRGERMITAFTGDISIAREHEDFEREGRVAPVHVNLHHFHAIGKYGHKEGTSYSEPSWGHSERNRLVERHKGRHRFVSDMTLALPPKEIRIIYTPTAGHAWEIASQIQKDLEDLLLGGKIDAMDALALMPLVLHAEGTGKKKKEGQGRIPLSPEAGGESNPEKKKTLSKKEMEEIVERLKAGKIRCAVVTDFLAVGVDTDKFDHIIDASGQMAKAMSLQRGGRAVRPREGKIAQIHIIVDNHNQQLFFPQKEKVKTLLSYYGLISPENVTGEPGKRGVTIYRKGTTQTYAKMNIHMACPTPKEDFDTSELLEKTRHDPNKDLWGGFLSRPGNKKTPENPEAQL